MGEICKINKKNGCKEFSSHFKMIGQICPIKRKTDDGAWVDQPLFALKKTEGGKSRRLMQFQLETALGNKLRIELGAIEFSYIYPYSSKHKQTAKVKWENRLDKEKWKDENGKVEIDETFHANETDWDKLHRLAREIKMGDWVQVKGRYEPNTMVNKNGEEVSFLKRVLTSVDKIDENGQVKNYKGEMVNPIKIGKGEYVPYVMDFKSKDFIEVNSLDMQIGIRSTYQEENGNTRVNAVYLMNGKDHSIPQKLTLTVYQAEAKEGKKTLADAFAELEKFSFIEVVGRDNNRVIYDEVEVEEEEDYDNPFADVDCEIVTKRTKKERVIIGEKKGLEITGLVKGSYRKDFLTEEEMSGAIKEERQDISKKQERKLKEDKEESLFQEEDDYDPFGDDDDPFAFLK